MVSAYWYEAFNSVVANQTDMIILGMNVMMYYISCKFIHSILSSAPLTHFIDVFAMAGLTGNVGLYSSSIQYVINVLMTVPALVWIDRWGRRKPLLIGCTFMMIWMYANAGILATYGRPAPAGGLNGIPQESWQISGAPAKAVIACTYLFVASFAPSM